MAEIYSNDPLYYDQPLYAIFRRSDNGLHGYIEESWCMSWSASHVRLWTKADVDYIFKRFGKNAYNTKVFIARVRSEKCPANIVFDKITKDMGKYERRNKKFTEKT